MSIRGFTSKTKVHDELISVNPGTIFRRISPKKFDAVILNLSWPISHCHSLMKDDCARPASEEEINQCSELQQVVNIFRDENACPGDIDDAGYKVLIALYGRKKSEEKRDSRIFKLFQKSLVKNNFILVFLPPSTAAAREHSLRAYLQVQHGSGFAKRPLDWCWKETKHGLFSVTTHKDSAAPALLSMISLQVRKSV
ncbi:hypothetical protein AVEN_92823-1 [Araneus ventricosus]|uniref:Uncharacterized protein n=1 Tax=Araneus ventricosus TaxID=182803 RepID=A0A4Y2IXT4_ARAVE|nr:hypothetical protein AVEN_92823-1 [Araneus ventricosus]